MIAWLASYPRSGNTLLRAVLWETLGLKSFGDPASWERIMNRPPDVPGAKARMVSDYTRMPEEPWNSFYPWAIDDEELFLVKNHEGPTDDLPAIFVVRDGRKSCYSYSLYHRERLPAENRTLLEIVAGDDYFGDWSSSFRQWTDPNRGAPVLVLKYEELVEASEKMVARIADFLGLAGKVEPKPWNNPFEDLRQARPDFFREGLTAWSGEVDWTPEIEWVFRMFHSELMEELGYEPGLGPNFPGDEFSNIARMVVEILDQPRVPYRSVRRSEVEEARLRNILAALL